MAFTFKKHKRSAGLAGVGEGDWVDIKIKKKIVGNITGGSWRDDNGYKIRLALIDYSIYSGFKWITLNHKPESLELALEFVKNNFEAITSKYSLHSFE